MSSGDGSHHSGYQRAVIIKDLESLRLAINIIALSDVPTPAFFKELLVP
jgi:hypothetical protein